MSILSPSLDPRRVITLGGVNGANFAVEATSLGDIIGSDVDLTRFAIIAIQARADAVHDWRLGVQWRADNTVGSPTYGQAIVAVEWVSDVSNFNRTNTGWVEVCAPKARFYVENLSGDEHRYDVRIRGIR